MTRKNGAPIFATATRTCIPSGVMGNVTADNIVSWIKTGRPEIKHKASMGHMGPIVSFNPDFTVEFVVKSANTIKTRV